MKAAAILFTTFHVNEHLIDTCIQVLDHFWPEHPPVIVLSDRGEFKHPERIIVPEASWTKILAQGLEQAIQQYGYFTENDYVLLLLEDHIPLSPLPLDSIDKALEYAANQNMEYLALFGHGKGALVHQNNEFSLYQRKPDYRFYTELHPAFWKAGYLAKIAEHSIKESRLSAWDFETQNDFQNHYTTDLLWTSKLGGFLAGGHVDRKVLDEMKDPQLNALKKQLRSKAIRAFPKRLWKRAFKSA